MSSNACHDHKLAVPNSWGQTKLVGELASMMMRYRKINGVFPRLCKKCDFWDMTPDLSYLLRDLKGSIKGNTELVSLLQK